MTLLTDSDFVARATDADLGHPVFRRIAALKHGCEQSDVTPEQFERLRSAVMHTAILNPLRAEYTEEDRETKTGHFLARAGITQDHPSIAEIMRHVDALLRGDVTFPSLVRQSVYRHFKGGMYNVLFKAHDCEDPQRVMVVYVHQRDGSMWVRDLTDFVQMIEWPDGKLRSRFLRLA